MPRRDARRTASCLPSASASEAVISEMTKPAPSAAAWRLNGASVTPDIGASTTRFGRMTFPIARGAARLWSVGWVTREIAHELGATIAAYILANCPDGASAASQQSAAVWITFALAA